MSMSVTPSGAPPPDSKVETNTLFQLPSNLTILPSPDHAIPVSRSQISISSNRAATQANTEPPLPCRSSPFLMRRNQGLAFSQCANSGQLDLPDIPIYFPYLVLTPPF